MLQLHMRTFYLERKVVILLCDPMSKPQKIRTRKDSMLYASLDGC